MESVAYAASVGVPRVALVSLGCARNEVDSEELAGRLGAGGFQLVEDAEDADAVVVNTCGFVESAKRESVDVLLDAATPGRSGRTPVVVAVGCMAERYGRELAEALPEADAVLGFDHYPDIAERLQRLLEGGRIASHAPRDRRTLLPLAPVDRPSVEVRLPGHGQPRSAVIVDDRPAAGPVGTLEADRLAPAAATAGHAWVRRRISGGPAASLKIASGCDRRCAFCAIPTFRGSFVSRGPGEILDEARWLVDQGVREVVLVSENSTSYGKDMGDPRALESLLTDLAGVAGIERIRVSYLQPAEIRPGLIATMTDTPTVADYFDLSFQHASPGLLRRMRRFGGAGDFLSLIDRIRAGAPDAGIRSNVIVGFPGETAADVDQLLEFLGEAQLDAVGVFGYSDEEGTEGARLPGKVDAHEIRARVSEVSSLVDEVMAQRAADRVGEQVDVLVEAVDGIVAEGRAAHQGQEDGATAVHLTPEARDVVRVGSLVRGRVVASDGVDLQAVEVSVVRV